MSRFTSSRQRTNWLEFTLWLLTFLLVYLLPPATGEVSEGAGVLAPLLPVATAWTYRLSGLLLLAGFSAFAIYIGGILPAHRACGAATAGTLHGGALHDDALHGHPFGRGTYLPAPHPAPELRHVSGYAPATRQPLHRASRRCPLAGLSRLPTTGPRHHSGANTTCAPSLGDPSLRYSSG